MRETSDNTTALGFYITYFKWELVRGKLKTLRAENAKLKASYKLAKKEVEARGCEITELEELVKELAEVTKYFSDGEMDLSIMKNRQLTGKRLIQKAKRITGGNR